MSEKKRSKRSSRSKTIAERKGYVVPERTLWAEWQENEIHTIEFEGQSFEAAIHGYTISIGTKLKRDRWGGVADPSAMLFYAFCGNLQNDSNSCAYHRIFPTGSTLSKVAQFKWWLHNIVLDRGTVAYLIPADGKVVKLTKALTSRGFRLVCVTPSIHAGNYPVYLFVHPGDKLLKQKTTKRVDLDDILGTTIGGDEVTGTSGVTAGRDKQDRPVPKAVPGAEIAVGCDVDF